MLNRMQLALVVTACLALAGAPGAALAQAGADNSRFVTKDEYDQLLKRCVQMEKEMAEMRERLEKAAPTPPSDQAGAPSFAPTGFVTQAAFDEFRGEVADAKSFEIRAFNVIHGRHWSFSYVVG